MFVTVITPPAPVVTWDEAKVHLALETDERQSAVEALIAAATAWARKYTGRSIGSQTLEARFGWLDTTICLPFGPVTSVTSVKYLDRNYTEQTIDPAVYQSLTDGRLALKPSQSWPSTYFDPEAIRVRYVAGDVPEPIKSAILLVVGFLNENREASADDVLVSGPVKWLLSPYKAFV